MTRSPPTVTLNSPVDALHVVTVEHLRLRESPSTSSAVLRHVPRGHFVTVLGTSDHGRWSQVSYAPRGSKATLGWMASKYLRHSLSSISVPTEEFPWMALAMSEIGVTELPEDANHPRIVEYLRSTDLDPAAADQDSTPWCSGFVNWCVEKSGLAGTNSAGARSWLDWGRPIVRPRRGCITVLTRAARPTGGHVGFYLGQGDLTFGGGDRHGLQLLGGNQNNQVGVQEYDPARLLGYRVPRGAR